MGSCASCSGNDPASIQPALPPLGPPMEPAGPHARAIHEIYSKEGDSLFAAEKCAPMRAQVGAEGRQLPHATGGALPRPPPVDSRYAPPSAVVESLTLASSTPGTSVSQRRAAGVAAFLVVDDMPTVARAHVRVVARLFPGAIIHTAHSAREAVRILDDASIPIDVVLTDFHMGELNGDAVAARAKTRNGGGVPLVIMASSEATSAGVIAAARLAGVDVLVEKGATIRGSIADAVSRLRPGLRPHLCLTSSPPSTWARTLPRRSSDAGISEGSSQQPPGVLGLRR